MLVIDDKRVCSKCGAYLDGYGLCASGHYVESPISIEEFEKNKNEVSYEKNV